MKKLLLCAVVCTGQMYGMEPLYPPKFSKAVGQDYMAMLPTEIKQHIVYILAQSSTLEEAVNAIRSLTKTSTEFNAIINDSRTTRIIINLLVQKFNAPSEYIAKKLSTPGSQKYVDLSLQLKTRLFMKDFNFAENLIKAGADINYQTVDIYPMLCGPKEVLLLNMLNKAHLIQATIAHSKQHLLHLEKMATQSPEAAKRVQGSIKAIQQKVESDQEELNNLISIIHDQVQRNKNIFKDDKQFNHCVAEINNGNFKKAFVVLEPNTIISNDPTDYWYTIGEADVCMVGANLSLVMYAIAANQPALLEWLIKHNANLDLAMGTGDAALAMAINLGNKEIVELLVKNGANVNQQNILSINENLNEKIKESGAVATLGDLNQTPIFNVHTGEFYTVINYDTLTLIMSNGLDLFKNTPLINLLNSDQFTDEEQYDLVKLLLDNGANPNMQDADGNIPLTFALSLESKFMKLLLDRGANPNIQDDIGGTPLITLTFMQREGSANAMELLLDYGADPLIKDNEGLTALDHTRSEEAEEDPERDQKIEILKNAIKKQQKK